METKRVAVIGAAGFVGSQIAKAVNEDERYLSIPILREDPIEELIKEADIVVHAANPARRFWAEEHPNLDFEETVEKTAKIFALSEGKSFVLISSISCRTQMYINYGRNRRACELLIPQDSNLIIRLGAMYGGDRKFGALYDIINGNPVYVGAGTQYAYVDVAWVGKKVVNLLDGPTGICEIGARNAVCLRDICKHFHSKSEFSGHPDTQIPENNCPNGPDANGVYKYVEENMLEELK